MNKRFANSIDKIDYIICLIATLIGGALRILGYNWGTDTMLYQVDEGRMVDPVIEMVENKTIFYDSFAYPAHCFSKLQAFIILVYRHFWGEPYNFLIKEYLICRIVTAIAGTMTIVSIFLIGNYIREHVGTISACIFAVSPIMIMMSKQVTGDVTTLFVSSVIMIFALRYIDERKTKYIVFMSILAAMATMEKWHSGANGVFIGIIILLFSRSVGEFFKKGILAFSIYIVSVIAIAPDITWNLQGAIKDFFNIAVWDGGRQPSYFENLKAYISNSYMGLGVVYIVFTILGLFFVIKSRDKRFLVLLLGVVKVILLCFMNRTFPRWALELFYVQIILIAYAISMLFTERTFTRIIAYAGSGIVIAEMALVSIFLVIISMANEQDVRYLQEEFCKENGLNIDNTISGRYTAFNSAVRLEPGYLNASDDGSDLFSFQDGTLYKIQDVEYYVWSGRSYHMTDGILEYLDGMNCCMWSETLKYRDIANTPYEKMKSKNDFVLCGEYLSAIRNMLDGAVIGTFDVKIYNISEVPYLEVGE